jgi:hypothetical protein
MIIPRKGIQLLRQGTKGQEQVDTNPEQYYIHIPISAGVTIRYEHGPLFHLTSSLHFIQKYNEFSRAIFFKKFLLLVFFFSV